MIAYKYNNDILFESDLFIYEVELYVQTMYSWNLEDAKEYSSKIFIEGLVECITHNCISSKAIKYTNLISAPKNWLDQNTKSFEYIMAKDIRKEKREKSGKL